MLSYKCLFDHFLILCWDDMMVATLQYVVIKLFLRFSLDYSLSGMMVDLSLCYSVLFLSCFGNFSSICYLEWHLIIVYSYWRQCSFVEEHFEFESRCCGNLSEEIAFACCRAVDWFKQSCWCKCVLVVYNLYMFESLEIEPIYWSFALSIFHAEQGCRICGETTAEHSWRNWFAPPPNNWDRCQYKL